MGLVDVQMHFLYLFRLYIVLLYELYERVHCAVGSSAAGPGLEAKTRALPALAQTVEQHVLVVHVAEAGHEQTELSLEGLVHAGLDAAPCHLRAESSRLGGKGLSDAAKHGFLGAGAHARQGDLSHADRESISGLIVGKAQKAGDSQHRAVCREHGRGVPAAVPEVVACKAHLKTHGELAAYYHGSQHLPAASAFRFRESQYRGDGGGVRVRVRDIVAILVIKRVDQGPVGHGRKDRSAASAGPYYCRRAGAFQRVFSERPCCRLQRGSRCHYAQRIHQHLFLVFQNVRGDVLRLEVEREVYKSVCKF